MSNSVPPWAKSDAELGTSQADMQEWHLRSVRRQIAAGEDENGGAAAATTALSWIVPLFLLLLPVLVLVTLTTGLFRGTTWLADESVLAAAFPAPGDSITRYIVSSLTLLLALPGSLVLLGGWLRHTRLRAVAVYVLVPVAALLVPVVLFVTQSTTSVDLLRLGS